MVEREKWFKRYEDIFSNDRVKVICLSDAWKEQIQPLLGEVHVIENPIHPRHKPSQSKEEGKICLIGRKDSVKGHDFAIELINRLNKKGMSSTFTAPELQILFLKIPQPWDGLVRKRKWIYCPARF